jgi:hypothetical protein
MNSIRSSKEYWTGTHENIVIDNSSFFRAQSLGVTKLGRELVWHSQHCIILDGNDCWNESIAMNWIASGRVYITDAWQSIRNREEKKNSALEDTTCTLSHRPIIYWYDDGHYINWLFVDILSWIDWSVYPFWIISALQLRFRSPFANNMLLFSQSRR